MSLRKTLAPLTALAAAACVLLLLARPASADLSFPPLSGRVVDDAGILSGDAKTRLEAMSYALEQKTTDQLVVVTLKSLQGDTIEQYGYQLGRHWGIGQSCANALCPKGKTKNNGVLLIVAPNEHRVRIEVGYGLEGTLTDAQSKLIIENIITPAFRRGDFDGGVLAGSAAILQVLGVETKDVDQVLSQQATADQADQDDGQQHGGGLAVIIAIFVIWLVFGRFLWPLFFLGGLGGGGWRGGGFGGGGFGGGGFGGGGFSGGGGSFGGGGASGSW